MELLHAPVILVVLVFIVLINLKGRLFVSTWRCDQIKLVDNIIATSSLVGISCPWQMETYLQLLSAAKRPGVNWCCRNLSLLSLKVKPN